MTRMLATILVVCISATSCVVPNIDPSEDQQPVEDRTRVFCPPLPELSQTATKFERDLWTQTVIELYRQCAESKK